MKISKTNLTPITIGLSNLPEMEMVQVVQLSKLKVRAKKGNMYMCHFGFQELELTLFSWIVCGGAVFDLDSSVS